MTTKAERVHMGRVAALGCYLCRHLGLGDTPAQVHHVREGQGMAQRASNWLTVPLCEKHHARRAADAHAEYIGRNTLTLPLFPTMHDSDVARVVDTLVSIVQACLKP